MIATLASRREPNTTAILPPRAAGGAIRELDGLRGVAVLLVMLHHLWPTKGALAGFTFFADLGWIGVDLFFVISGTLITGILVDSRGSPAYFKNFYARRALRIFPLYYLFIAAVFGAAFLSGHEGAFLERSGSPLYYVFYLGNVPEAFFGKDPPYFLAVLWSLAIEEQFYIVFPTIVAALSRKALTRLLVALVVLVPLLRVMLTFVLPDNPRLEYLFIFCRADVIALGGLIAIAVRTPAFQPPRWLLDVAAVAGFASVALAFHLGGLSRETFFGRTFGYSIVGLAFASVVLWTLANREASRSSAFRFAPLCYMGQLCYGLYLLHRPADTLVMRLLGRLPFEVAPALVTVLELGVSLGLAMLSWYAFEKPILRLKRWFARDGSRNPGAGAEIKASTGPEAAVRATLPAPGSR